MTVDTIAPTTGAFSLLNFTDTGVSNSDRVSSDNVFGFQVANVRDQGTGLGKVVVSWSGADTGSATVNYAGQTSTQTAVFGDRTFTKDGTYTFTALVYDVAGNSTAPAQSFTITIDTTAPTPGELKFVDLAISGRTIDDTPYTNDKVFTLTVDGADGTGSDLQPFTFQVSTNGTTWGAPPVSYTDGLYYFRAIVTDAAGNTAVTDVKTVFFDTLSPVFDSLGADFTPFTTQDSVNYTNAASFNVSVSGIVDIGGALASGIWKTEYYLQTGTGMYELLTEPVNPQTLSEGLYSFRATVYDNAGNSTGTNTYNVFIDRTAPSAGTLQLTSFDAGQTVDGVIYSKDTSFGFAVDGASYSGSGLKESATLFFYSTDGTNYSSSLPGSFVQGSYWFKAQVFDLAGNDSFTSTVRVIIDTQLTAGTLTLADFEDTGSQEAPGTPVTTVKSFAFVTSGAEDGVTYVYEYSSDDGDTWTEAPGGSLPGLDDGSYIFRALVTDRAGNSNYIDSDKSVIVDNTKPTFITFGLVASTFTDSGNPNDKITNDALFSLKLLGVIEKNPLSSDFVVFEAKGPTGDWYTVSAGFTNEDDEDFFVDFAANSGPGTDGDYSFRATLTDKAGNKTVTDIFTITIDRVAVPGTLSLDNFIDSGSSDTDFITNDGQFTLKLTDTEEGATVQWQWGETFDDTIEWSDIDSADINIGNLPPPTFSFGASDGIYVFRALVTDVAGNTAYSNLITVTVDRIAIAGTLTLQGLTDTGTVGDRISQSNSFSLALSGNELNSTVVYQVSNDGTTWTDLTGPGATTISGLEDGDYYYRAKVTDLAGNKAYATVDKITVDRTPPQFTDIVYDNQLDRFTITGKDLPTSQIIGTQFKYLFDNNPATQYSFTDAEVSVVGTLTSTKHVYQLTLSAAAQIEGNVAFGGVAAAGLPARAEDWLKALITVEDAAGNVATSLSTSVRFHWTGTASDDTFVGSTKDDIFRGGLGADIMYGNGGDDRFLFAFGESNIVQNLQNPILNGVSPLSRFSNFDVVRDFNAGDKLEFLTAGNLVAQNGLGPVQQNSAIFVRGLLDAGVFTATNDAAANGAEEATLILYDGDGTLAGVQLQGMVLVGAFAAPTTGAGTGLQITAGNQFEWFLAA